MTRSVGDLLVGLASLGVVGVDLAVAVLGLEGVKAYADRLADGFESERANGIPLST